MPIIINLSKEEYTITSDPDKFDYDAIFNFLSVQSHWSKGISMDLIKKSIANSTTFAVFHHQRQVGMARIITDYATIVYLGDVFIDPEYRGKGLSKWLMEVITSIPELQGMRRWFLTTKDAHSLYEKTGFKAPLYPERFMEIFNPDVYKKDS
ncbi:MAG TPA: GNAT family N-acetyltransferase [Bacteroidia bacterium]|jgi:GNAT superfamily N-acetyltransferase|nr:GNAT family N-acetyltransferase [Bacteroidia bacterium]HQK98287.1 GNAT family N-acetyltransferase [Bacteroidia bacterium]